MQQGYASVISLQIMNVPKTELYKLWCILLPTHACNDVAQSHMARETSMGTTGRQITSTNTTTLNLLASSASSMGSLL